MKITAIHSMIRTIFQTQSQVHSRQFDKYLTLLFEYIPYLYSVNKTKQIMFLTLKFIYLK